VFRIVWTGRGERSFAEILRSVARIDVQAAERLRMSILETTAVLEQHPYIGARYEQVPPLREILCDRYRIFYLVSKARKVVGIHLVWHSARAEPEF